jgi:hypothetical protein
MQTSKRESLFIIANSTAFYLISYLSVLLLFQFTTIAAAKIFDIPTTLFFNRIDFYGGIGVWTFDSVKIVYGSGNVMLFLLSILFLVVTIKAMEYDGLLRLFFLWGFINSISMLLGAFIIGAFNYEGLGVVLSYLYLADTAKMLILFIGIITLIGIGMAMVKPMLFTANMYYKFLSAEMRMAFRFKQFVFPYLIATAVLYALKYPLTLYETLLLTIPVFVIAPLFIGVGLLPTYFFEETEKPIHLSLKLMVIALIFILLFRVVLGIGIKFG